MVKRFAVVPVAGGIVENVVVGESLEIVAAVVGECVEETTATGVAGPGYGWDGFVFAPKPGPEYVWDGTAWIVPEPAPPGE